MQEWVVRNGPVTKTKDQGTAGQGTEILEDLIMV